MSILTPSHDFIEQDQYLTLLRDMVEKELQRLLQEGTLEPVTSQLSGSAVTLA